MINQTNKAGKTSLHRATEGGQTTVIDELLSHRSDINFLTSQGQSCLHLASELCNNTDSEVVMTPSLSQVYKATFLDSTFGICYSLSILQLLYIFS